MFKWIKLYFIIITALFFIEFALMSLVYQRIELRLPLISTLIGGVCLFTYLVIMDSRRIIMENKLSTFKKFYEEQNEAIKQKITIDKDKELLNLERKHLDEIKSYQQQLQQVKSDAQKEIDKYQAKYLELLESKQSVK